MLKALESEDEDKWEKEHDDSDLSSISWWKMEVGLIDSL